jgi:hypothetical protein
MVRDVCALHQSRSSLRRSAAVQLLLAECGHEIRAGHPSEEPATRGRRALRSTGAERMPSGPACWVSPTGRVIRALYRLPAALNFSPNELFVRRKRERQLGARPTPRGAAPTCGSREAHVVKGDVGSSASALLECIVTTTSRTRRPPIEASVSATPTRSAGEAAVVKETTLRSPGRPVTRTIIVPAAVRPTGSAPTTFTMYGPAATFVATVPGRVTTIG